MKSLTLIPALAVTSLLATVPASAAQTPYSEPDGSWLSLSGTANNPKKNSFTLDYGESTVLVEMDDWSIDADAAGLIDGDKVTVYGRVDDDFAETTSIEASSVYVESLGQYFFANASDEESRRYSITTPITVGDIELTGTVSQVSDDQFTVNTGLRKITVDTSELHYNPLDNYGFQQVGKGDLVTVDGNMESNLLTTKSIVADAVIILEKNSAS